MVQKGGPFLWKWRIPTQPATLCQPPSVPAGPCLLASSSLMSKLIAECWRMQWLKATRPMRVWPAFLIFLEFCGRVSACWLLLFCMAISTSALGWWQEVSMAPRP